MSMILRTGPTLELLRHSTLGHYVLATKSPIQHAASPILAESHVTMFTFTAEMQPNRAYLVP